VICIATKKEKAIAMHDFNLLFLKKDKIIKKQNTNPKILKV